MSLTPVSMPESLPDSLEARYAEVRDRVSRAADRAGRKDEEIVLVAVTKTAAPDQIRALIDLGHRDFGENRVQQLVQRASIVEEYFSRLRVLPNIRRARDGAQGVDQDTLFVRSAGSELLAPTSATSKPSPSASGVPDKSAIRWHMIGHLQRNKARKIAEFTRLVHSVDSLRLAEELQTVAIKRDQIIDVLVQVNCSGEATKFGCPVPAAIPLAEQIETMINVRVRGLMTMGPLNGDQNETRATFSRCRELFEEMRTRGIGEGRFNLLSMGMSGDFEIAIAEGANIVRVGSAIFGAGVALPDEEREDPNDPSDADGDGDES